MNTKGLVWTGIIIVAVILAWSVWSGSRATDRVQAAEEPETPEQCMARLRSKTRSLALIECSNQVVGITAIIRCDVHDFDPAPNKWRAEASVDHINRVGGIERTNLFLSYFVSGGGGRRNIYCQDDLEHALAKMDAEYKDFLRHRK